jgi:hypothetical protein
MPRRKGKAARPGDWDSAKIIPGNNPASALLSFTQRDYEQEIYSDLENPKTSALSDVLTSVKDGKSKIVEAAVFCARFRGDGTMLRESKDGSKPYKIVVMRGTSISKEDQEKLKESHVEIDESWPFQSSSDLGSTFNLDPNQYTEFTPYFNGPFSKQQYFDYFKGHARAFQEYNHNPAAKRIVDIFIQYAFGRGFKVLCRNDSYSDKWDDFNRNNRITHKMRKYWMREYLVYGENFIDKIRWISVDPSTIYDIICEGYDEYIDNVLYYYQMFQTATQMYSGIDVKGVAGSKDSKIGHYIVRQIPYDQIIHIKANVMSIEKRGRSILYPILGWLKRLVDTLNSQVLGEQLRASFVWDDTVNGSAADVAAHAQKFNYIPVAPSIFVHNKAVERKPLAPMSGVSVGQSNVTQEILALIATAVGLPKEHLNVMMQGGSNRATAVVGSEPFTKVIEDLQEDGNDLIHQIIQAFCEQNQIDYIEQDWQIIFPSVQKDAINDRLKAIMTCEMSGWFSHERAATMAAAEMEADSYDYEQEMKKSEEFKQDQMIKGLPGNPAPNTGNPGKNQQPDNKAEKKPSDTNPIHGKGKADIIAQHKKL